MGMRLPTIMISGQGDIPDAVEAIKLGAIDYLRKPVDPAHLDRVLRKLADTSPSAKKIRICADAWLNVGELGPLFGRSLPDAPGDRR